MSNFYERVRIQGRLVCLTPISVGSGAMPTLGEAGKNNEPANRLDICKRQDGTPYLPGSSLRGLLASLLPTTDPAHARLFGEARGQSDDSKKGALRVYDAVLDKATGSAAERTRTSIDPITGTAKDRHLYNLVQLPAGAEFDCTFEIEGSGQDTVEIFLGLLWRLHSDNDLARLGRGGNKSEGRVAWRKKKQSIQILNTQALAAWLLSDRVDRRELPFSLPHNPFTARQLPADESRQEELRFKLELRASGPLLVDGLEKTEPYVSTSGEQQELRLSGFRRETRAGKPSLIVPASSLRGLLRGHCRKILLTLLVHHLKEEPPYSRSIKYAEEWLGELFGHQQQASAILFKDVVVPEQDYKLHRQPFNAVDRFTGGVADTALYTVEAATVEKLEASLRIKLRFLKPEAQWWKGLLILAMRDAMEGELALGWGKSKGYGALQLVRVSRDDRHLESWDGLRKSEKYMQTAKSWVEALHQKLSEV